MTPQLWVSRNCSLWCVTSQTWASDHHHHHHRDAMITPLSLCSRVCTWSRHSQSLVMTPLSWARDDATLVGTRWRHSRGHAMTPLSWARDDATLVGTRWRHSRGHAMTPLPWTRHDATLVGKRWRHSRYPICVHRIIKVDSILYQKFALWTYSPFRHEVSLLYFSRNNLLPVLTYVCRYCNIKCF